MNNVTIFDHPLIQHKTSVLRKIETTNKEFRELVEEITMLMCYESLRDLPLEEVEIETPIKKTKQKIIISLFCFTIMHRKALRFLCFGIHVFRNTLSVFRHHHAAPPYKHLYSVSHCEKYKRYYGFHLLQTSPLPAVFYLLIPDYGNPTGFFQ